MTDDRDPLLMYTVFHRPLEYPGVAFLAREFSVTADGVTPGWIVGMHDTLEQTRLMIPGHADHRLSRSDGDHPTVVETWV